MKTDHLYLFRVVFANGSFIVRDRSKGVVMRKYPGCISVELIKKPELQKVLL